VLFALHPVQVESVAWISELKNTLSGTFYFASAIAYLRFDRTRRPAHYALALVLFALAVLSKTVASALPAGLLVALWWQRGRLRWRADVAPLAPWLAIGAAAGAVTAWVERTYIGATGAEFALSIPQRAIVAGHDLWFYLATIVWPGHLSFNYPRWQVDASDPAQWIYPIAAVGAFAAAWLIRRRTRAPFAALAFFAVTLAPALGFVNVFPFRYSFVADHFQYLACAGIFALAGAAVAVACRRIAARRAGVLEAAAVIVLAVGCGAATWRYSRLFADAETLYRATIDRNPSGWFAHNNLGILMNDRGDNVAAIAEYREAQRLDGSVFEPHENLGVALEMQDRYDAAVPELTRALAIRPGAPEAHEAMGLALLHTGQYDAAVAQLSDALQRNADLPEARRNLADAYNVLGVALEGRRRYAEALRAYSEAERFGAPVAMIETNVARALIASGRRGDAEPHLRAALRDQPGFAPAHLMMGTLLAFGDSPADLQAAADEFATALALQPNLALARENLMHLAALGVRPRR
jgi:tetratricopeptide (TPR) repeat protein